MQFGALGRTDVVVAHTLSELLAARAEGRLPFAGGTDLLVRAVHGQRVPPPLVWTGHVPELRVHVAAPNEIRIGAAAPFGQLQRDPALRRLVPALLDASEIVGSPQIRSRATLGGNLCNASPAADTVPPMLVHAGRVVVAGPGGVTRTVDLTDFCLGPGQVALHAGEVVVSVILDPCGASSASLYRRFTYRKSMDLAFVGVAAQIDVLPGTREILRAELALGAVGPTAIRLPEVTAYLSGRVLTAADVGEIADAAAETAQPITDLRASAGYRRRIVRALVRDVLMEVWQRSARGAVAA